MKDPIQIFFDGLISPFSQLTGFSLDITRQVLNLIFYFALSLIWGFIKKPFIRHLLSISTGLFLLVFDYGLFPTLYYLFVAISSYILIFTKQNPYIVMYFSLFFSFSALVYYTITTYCVWQV
jgi:hypothetical protein